MDNSNGSTLIDIKGIQAQFFCFDIQTNSVIIIGETSQGYLLHLQRIDANRNITKVHLPYVEHPTEITCVAEKRVAVISHGNELVIFEIENLTWTTLQTPYQEAHLRLAVHQTDNDIFCAETKQNEIFRLSYDGKYFTKVYEGNEGEITDFDVDHTFVYVLTKNPRQILMINKSDGSIFSRLNLSQMIGHISKVIFIPVKTEGNTQKNTGDGKNDPGISIWVQIVVPIVLSFVVIFALVIVILRRKGRTDRDCKTNVEAVNNNEIKEQHKHNEVYEVRVRMTKIKMKKTGGDEGTKKRAGIQQKDSDRGSEP
ncbi:uncharacterized protein LOC134240603 [Saccostrea cucullata]|uniref:uncharacterized protein LOC134240603 n=1 Tax=Saccostrea cuccullata TaxID=36930 RepID=UPI002ED1865B